MLRIHVNSNGMCGACVGESYHLILDALCEHEGGGGRGGGGGVCNENECLCASTCVCVPVPDGCVPVKADKKRKKQVIKSHSLRFVDAVKRDGMEAHSPHCTWTTLLTCVTACMYLCKLHVRTSENEMERWSGACRPSVCF